ncbi:hypothetical protein Taro_048074 [Colocasia esculenta]|uniref:Acylphosphatase n=1 Tax=Colocasia esculenta TaxID=4460 RepID=A0A843X225_COLES|nr:hypothetical protein [Colocasia esculenta]
MGIRKADMTSPSPLLIPSDFISLTLSLPPSAPARTEESEAEKAAPSSSSPMSIAAISCSTPPMPPSQTVKVVIKGRVQGVFFRDWTVQNARELGLKGWVRNRRDGSVEALFSGEPAKVQEMVERRCRVGPPSAVVTALQQASSQEDPGAEGFQRRPTV